MTDLSNNEMQKKAARELFTATSKEFGEAALRAAIRDHYMRVFILDDARSIVQAINGAGISLPEKSMFALVRPFRWSEGEIKQTLDDAVECISKNPKFDLWVLDNDLGEGLEGFHFLKMMIETNPDLVPDRVVSCSANPVRRQAIIDYHASWLKSMD